MTEKIFTNNPYLKNIRSKIIETQFKDGHYYVILDRTIFYPHLVGGQPRDKGTMDNIEVIDVYEKNHAIIHVINEKLQGKNVSLSIDWDHRFDIMQQHTGQHILSLAIHKLFNSNTISFHMGEEYSSIDIDLINIDEKQIKQIELLANKIIQGNFPIKTYIQDGSKDLRIVEIDGMDYNHCCGTHLYSTGETGIMKIIGASNYKGGSRIEFLCGIRALQDYSMKNKSLKDISKLLSTNHKDAFTKIENLFANHKLLEKENRDLRKELYKLKAEIYLKESKEINGIKYIFKEFKDIDVKELSLISSNLNQEKNLIQFYSIKSKDTGYFLVNRSNDLPIDLKEVLQEVSENIILKAGGSSGNIQGKSSLQLLDRSIQLLYEKIQEKLNGENIRKQT